MVEKTQRRRSTKAYTVRDYDFDSPRQENPDEDLRWLENVLKDKGRSKNQRRMKARRELERRQDEKQLRALIEDEWLMEPLR